MTLRFVLLFSVRSACVSFVPEGSLEVLTLEVSLVVLTLEVVRLFAATLAFESRARGQVASEPSTNRPLPRFPRRRTASQTTGQPSRKEPAPDRATVRRTLRPPRYMQSRTEQSPEQPGKP